MLDDVLGLARPCSTMLDDVLGHARPCSTMLDDVFGLFGGHISVLSVSDVFCCV